MRIPNIYTDLALTEKKEAILEGQAAHHLIKVLRMKAGDQLRLFNNTNCFYLAEITDHTKKDVTLNITATEVSSCESPLHTHLGQVMSRGDRMDYAIQKSTEMGVNEITPLTSKFCELKLNTERETKRLNHWQQIAISAAEQCGRPNVPTIHPIKSIEHWIDSIDSEQLSFVLHHRDTQKLSDIKTSPKHINLLIGPEGGLSQSEIALATSNNFIASTFGPRVMRTETAPVACLSILQWLWGDFQSQL